MLFTVLFIVLFTVLFTVHCDICIQYRLLVLFMMQCMLLSCFNNRLHVI